MFFGTIKIMKGSDSDFLMDVLLFLFAADFSLFFFTAFTSNPPVNHQGGSSGGGAGLNW